MADTYTLRSIIICDDVRDEVSGKQTIVGAYAGAITLNIFPATIPLFAIRIELKATKTKFDKIVFVVKLPSKKDLVSIEGEGRVPRVDIPSSLAFKWGPVTFSELGDYEMFLGLDGPLESIGTFLVHSDK